MLVYTADVEVRKQPVEESVFEFYHMGSRDYTQDHQAWQQMVTSAEQSH